MSSIGDELAAMVDELTAAGIPTSTVPTDLWTLAAAADVAALVGPPELLSLVKLDGLLRMDVPVTLAARGPELDAYNRLYDQLPTLLRVMRPLEPARQQRYTRGDASMVAYTVTCSRDVEE